MHDDWTVSKGGGLTGPGEGGGAVSPSAPGGGDVRISTVGGEIVVALDAALRAGMRPANIARSAAVNAVRLALGKAQQHADAAAVTAAAWPPLLVPVSAADVRWRPLPVVTAKAEIGDAEECAREALPPVPAADDAIVRGELPRSAPIGDTISPETGELGQPAAAEIMQEPAAAAERAFVPSRDPSRPATTATTADDAFSFRPGDRVMPAFPAERRVADEEARAEPDFSRLSRLPDAANAERAQAKVVTGGADTTSAMMAVSVPAAAGFAPPAAGGTTTDRVRPGGEGRIHLSFGGYVRRALRWAGIALGAWFAVMLALIVLFRFVDPPGSTLIAWQALTGTTIERKWVPLSRISRNLQHAVIVSEDGRFCQHWGIDPREVAAAIRRARDGVPRGASTITMQLAKNLFLWPSKSYLRKVLEVPLTLALEVVWPKERILEVYLNIVEWGPGVFGAEAAARHHFNKSVQRLSQQEAALLAVSLPNPISRDAGDPGRGTRRLASIIVSRMRSAGAAANCIAKSQ